ncbi:uncharacterized protein LOC134406607 [Elgaria multicarinata webbii]|uniref:uncharacterized protein LOC134406607 n=1 Tax=Elgaria multicarinata webbii TaxID=159646 RepID=UPI002FCCF871
MSEKELEQLRRRKAARTWANWLPGFLIYMAVLQQRFPMKAFVLTKYLDMIYRAYMEYEGGAWLAYDEAFRAALPRPGTFGATAAGTHAPIPMGHWQWEVERAVWQSVAPSTRASYQRADHGRRCAPVRVVICGHSMVFWAGRRAATSSFGTQLGFSQLANIQWLGRCGMRWERLLPTLFQAAASPPQVLIIHLGGNDLGLLKGKALILQAIADFKIIRQRWPGVVIIWSCILPRFAWRSGEIKPMERACRRVNGEIFRDLIKHGDVSIMHPAITLARRELYRQDGVHLSDIGNDLFLYDLQRGLQGVLGRWGGSD